MKLASVVFAAVFSGSSTRRESRDEFAGLGDPEKAEHPSEREQQGENGGMDEGVEGGNADEGNESDEEEHVAEQRTGIPFRRFASSTSSTSSFSFSRPSLPRWLVKTKDVLFSSHPDDKAFIRNYRTMPIVSGILIPFSILLEIPGLTEHWYVRVEGNKVVETKPNPALVDVAMAFSISCALIANIALVTRFLERRVKAMTITCAIFLTVHDVINFVTVLVFGIGHRVDDGFTYGQAFWMTVCSTIVSGITNVTILWDFFTTPNFANSGSGLTRNQRSLILITIIFLSYVGLGALLTSLLMNLSFINGLYFTIVTTLTIGFGDIVPVTAVQRSIVCLYAVFGIVILGAAVRVISQSVIEGLEVGYRLRVREFRRQRRERKKEAQAKRRWTLAVEQRLQERGLETWVPDDPTPKSDVGNGTSLHASSSHFHAHAKIHLNAEALAPAELEAAALDAGVPLDKFWTRPAESASDADQSAGRACDTNASLGGESARTAASLSAPVQLAPKQVISRKPKTTRWWAKCRRLLHPKVDENASTKVSIDPIKLLEKEEKRNLYIKVCPSHFMSSNVGCGPLFEACIGMELVCGFLDGRICDLRTHREVVVWFRNVLCFIAFTTIGYGDLVPVSPIGRAIFIFWALLGVGAMTLLISVITDAFSSRFRSAMHNKSFDNAVRNYRQKRRKAPRVDQPSSTRSASFPRKLSPVPEAIREKPAGPSSKPFYQNQLPQITTLEETEEHLQRCYASLPPLILEQVKMFREHVRYFLVANGHATARKVGALIGPDDAGAMQDQEVPEALRKFLDEIAEEEGISDRMKEEVWEDPTARNTVFMLSIEKGTQKMMEAAESALEVLAQRDRLANELICAREKMQTKKSFELIGRLRSKSSVTDDQR